MRFKRISSVLMIFVMLAGAVNLTPLYAWDRLPAFPGAEGGGMYSMGARASDNIEVYHVTSLNDSGAGSLRDAVSRGGRIVVFDVAGIIRLGSVLKIHDADNLTVLGQTAPGEGICIAGESVLFSDCDNVILRYLRIRPGDTCYSQEDGLGVRRCTNFIADHCSVTWSVDECLSAYENKDFTAQYCIISESLNKSLHAKGAHGYGGIWGGINASFHHNLVSTHNSRMPRIGTSATVHSYNDTPDHESLVDIRNNVFYNWRSGEMSYGGENGIRVNIVNNYYKPTIAKKNKLIFLCYPGRMGKGTTLYANGNVMEGNEALTADNRSGVFDLPNEGWCESISNGYTDENGRLWPNDQFLSNYPVTTLSAEDAYNDVLNNVGATYYRDKTDQRIINDVINGTVPSGSRSGEGIIDSPDDVGGYLPLHGQKMTDSDKDGIPDKWERENGLDPDSFDSTNITNGYTNLENYANDIIKTRSVGYNVSFDELAGLMEKAENADELFFDVSDWEELQNRLTKAKNIYFLPAPTQAAVDKAAEGLKAALDTMIVSDEAYLRAAIERAELMDTAPYTKESIKIMTDAVLSGKKALEDKAAEDFRLYADRIYSAVNGLKYGVKNALREETERIRAMDLSHLTAKSQGRIKDILDSAQDVYKNVQATDEEIDAALQSVMQTVTLGRYERKNKGSIIAVQDFETNENTEIFHTNFGNYKIETDRGTGSNQTMVATNHAASNKAWPYVCDFPYTPAHFLVSVDLKVYKQENKSYPLTLDKYKITRDNYLENIERYISAFYDWGKLSIEVDNTNGIIRYYINDMPIDEERISTSDFKSAYLMRHNSSDDICFDNFTLIDLSEKILIGDADADGILTASDCAEVLQKVLSDGHIMPVEENTQNWLKYIDTDADGVLTASDSAIIMQKVLTDTYIMPAESAAVTETTTETTETASEQTTQTTTEVTTETTTGDEYYPYKTPNGTIYLNLLAGRVVGCSDDYRGGTLPETVNGTALTIVDNGAFSGSNIEQIVIPKSYTRIARAFENCKKLKTVIIEETPSIFIYPKAFKDCTALENVTLPETLERINEDTFKGCTLLKRLVIPAATAYFKGLIAEPDCVLYVSSSAAENYAIQNGYQYVYLTPNEGL